jgi:hypothetical protein
MHYENAVAMMDGGVKMKDRSGYKNGEAKLDVVKRRQRPKYKELRRERLKRTEL